MTEYCIMCEGGRNIKKKAEWKGKGKDGEALCEKCWLDILSGYASFKRIRK